MYRLKDADPKKAVTFPDRLTFSLTDEELKGLTTQVCHYLLHSINNSTK